MTTNEPSFVEYYAIIYDFIAAYKAKHGFSPTLDDMAAGLKISRSSLFEHLEAMEKSGMIVQPRGFLRAFKLLSRVPRERPAVVEGGDAAR
jgi:hypothetical protein